MNEFGFVTDNEIKDNFGFVADDEEVSTQPVEEAPSPLLLFGDAKKFEFHPVDFTKSLGKGFIHGVSSIGTGLGKRIANPIRRKLGKEELTDNEIENIYGKFLGLEEDGGAYKTGKVVGEIAPYFLLPEAKVAQLGTVGNAALTGAYQGALGSGLSSVAEKGFDAKENLKDIAIGTAVGGALGGIAGKVGSKLERMQRAKDIAKRRATPLADRVKPQPTQAVDEVAEAIKPQVNQEVIEQPIQQIDDVIEEAVPIQQVDEVVEPQTISIQDKFLDKKNQGSIYKNKTWREVFEKRLDPKESKSWWIEKVYKGDPNGGLFDDDVFSHYQLRAEGTNYKTRVPKELNEYIERNFNTNDKRITNAIENISPQQLEQVVPQTPEGYKRLYRGLTQEYDPKYDRAKLDNVNNYESWTDNYDLAEAYGDNVYYIDVPENSIAKDIIDENPKSMTYGDRNLLYENDKPVGIKNKSGKEYLLYTGHEEYPNIRYNKINKPQKLDDVIPEQVVEDTAKMVSGETKTRSLPQSVLEAKGTPKEIKDIIKENPATYEVLKNKDLTAQANKELAGNFDNELIRLSSAKDFDALDYEKSRQIAKNLFGMGKYQQAVDLIDNVSENATKKGQAIQALSLWSNMTPEGAVYKAQKLVREYNRKHPKKQIQLTDENIETIANLQQEALNTTDELAKNQALARTAKYTADLIPKEALQKLKAYRNISMLLNPKTLGRNIVGNVVFNTADTISKAIASPIDSLIGLTTGQKTRVAPQLGSYFKGGLQGLAKGSSEALQGIDTRGLGQRFDLGSGRTFVGGNTERTTIADIINAQQGNKLDTTKQYFKELLPKSRLGQAITQRSLQPLKNIPSDLMNSLETSLDIGLRTPDRAFYEATFAESVENMMKASEPQREIARAELQKKLARAKSEKSIERINKQLSELDTPTQEILEQAEREALESVFQNKSMLSDFALGLRGGINRIGTKDFGLGDVLIPYAQTPANLTQQAINYSPLGALKGIYNLSQGNQRQASLDLARSLIGSVLIGGGYGLAKAGLTTPSQFDENYTKNKKIRENLQPLGIRPDQLGDMWYAPFQPMSSPIATGTAMAYGENPLYAGLNTVVDQPYLQGVTRGLRDLQEGDWTKAATNVVASIPSQFVPTFAGQLAQSIDPYQRETYDPNKLKYGLNSAIAKVPFASKTLPEKIDVTGQPIERYSTKGGQKLFDIFLNPTFINKKTTDPVLSELKYIYDQTKETSHFMPSVDKKLEFTDVDGNPQKIVLTGREFSEYQRRLGQRMYDEFNYVMDLPEYANADEYGKIKILENAKKLVKAEVDNEMWNKRNRNKKRSYTGGN